MKRRLLSAFLAVMMVLTMAPVAFAADTATSDGEALSKLFTDVHAGESGSGNVTVTIDKDYDLTGYQWTSLTVQGYTGAGVVTVEGNNHKITGLNAPLFAGGFAGTSGIVVKNLTLTKVTIKDSTSNQGIGAFINNVDSMPKIELDNCHLTDSSIDSNGGARVGGLIGWTSGYNKQDDGPVDTYITVTNCSVENTKITAKGSVGGIIGHAGANPATYHTFTNNTVTGCTLNSTDDGGWRVGVVVGTANVGEVALNNTTESGNTVTQTGKTAPAGQSNLYGRFVPGTTGKLVIDGTAVFDSSIVAVVDNKGYKTLADAVAAAQGGATVKLLKDVTEDVVIPADKTVTLDLNGKKLTNVASHTIFNKGTLTINGNKGTVDNVTHGKVAVYNIGKVTLNGGTYDRSKEDGIKDSNTYYTLLNHGTMTVANVTVNNKGGYSSLFENGYFDYNQSRDGIDNPTLTIESGTFTGGINTVKNDDGATMTINGGIFTNYAQSAFQNHNIATINGGTFNGATVYAILNCGTSCKSDAAPDLHQLTITDGNFNGKIYKGSDSKDGKTHYDIGSISISGGYFTVDPSAYCAEGKTGVASGNKEYPFTVGDVAANVEVAPAAPAASADTNGKSDDVKNAMKNTVNAITGTDNKTEIIGMDAIGGNEAAKVTPTDVANASTTLSNNGVSTENKTVTVYVQPYMDITVKDAVVGENGAMTSVTLDIVPKVKKIASTADTADGINLPEDAGTTNARLLEDKEVTVTTPVTLTIPLPDGFVTENLKVKHEKNGKLVGYHDATYNAADKTITFINDKGFSTFTVLSDARSTTIQFTDKDNHNIGSAKSYGPSNVNDALPTTAVESGYVFNGWKFEGIDGVYTTLTDELLTKLAAKGGTVSATPDFSKRSSGSSGGSSSGKTTYKVTTSAVNNGGVNASPSSAEKGATIIITLSPDKGYKLDKLTVTDGSGKTVSTVKKSDTVYTFTMPASAVKVGVSYVKATETPSETKFNDVSANDWFASAVDYVTGKGMMNGTADNTFSPKANTTRGMVVTVLYRLENQPSTSAASFTDVASGAYYANAVAWANANGIVSGYGSGKFGPNDKVTREQLAAILYRYAQYKKYDVSVGEDTNILSYNDAQSISSYAIPAIQWACGAGVVTGKSGSKLDPKGNATRAEVAAMLMRFCENVK